MITKENGLRFAKLIHVSVENGKTAQSNKVYIMEEQSDGNIKCEYGRVGKPLVTVFKPSSAWHKTYRNKIGRTKGYTDVTDMMVIETLSGDTSTNESKLVDIKCSRVKSLFDDLMSFANKSIQKNYKVTQESVTQAQIDAAQDILNEAVTLVETGMNLKDFNALLIRLYTTIPRKMKDVRDYLIDVADDADDIQKITNFLANEQDTLDTMAGQVTLLKQQKVVKDDVVEVEDNDEISLLQQMGLKVEIETDNDALVLIDRLLGSNKGKTKKIFKCVNTQTQTTFDNHYSKSKVKRRRLYWHGSRNENWFNIIQTGLMIRPSGAVHTGSMFGDGIYFASSAQKSIGYSSIRGSYWASGTSDKGYLALFDVHIGNQKDIHRHDSSCYSLSKSILDRDGYDSVYAHGGVDLRNDEFIIYDKRQCTIAYLIEM